MVKCLLLTALAFSLALYSGCIRRLPNANPAPAAQPAGTAEGPADPPFPTVRSDADLEALLPQLSNWKVWGRNDERGTLNYLTEERVHAAQALVKTGATVSLARPVSMTSTEGISEPRYEMFKEDLVSRDFLGAIWHGYAQTHLDALCHIQASASALYNGHAAQGVEPHGCKKLGVDVIAQSGVVGRGVLLDIAALHGGALEPGTSIWIQDLEAAAERAKVKVQEGDILMVRTGAGAKNTREKRAGLHPEVLVWLKRRRIALLVSDGDSDVAPLAGFDRWSSAIHSIGIPYLGLPLVDNAELDALSQRCAFEKRWEFLFVMAPWRLRGATSSPVNPIAIF